MKKFIGEIAAALLLTFFFAATTVLLVRSHTPERFFAFYAMSEILAFLFFSIYGALIVAIAASFVSIAVLIITANLSSVVAVASYWCLWIVLNRFVESLVEEY